MRNACDRWRRLACSLALLGWAFPSAAQAPAAALTDSQAKASALFNFARYVEWPERAFASREAPFVFCLAGRDSLSAASGMLEGRAINGRPTQLRRVLGVEDLRGCHALFIGESDERRQLPMLRALAAEPVLTVGDASGFTEAGGAIGVLLEEGRIRFDINRPALEQAQLRASSNLLRLARNTRQP